MELDEVVRRRHMARSFEKRPIGREVLDRVLARALRAPSAGNTQGTDLVVLEGEEQTSRYWDVTLPPPRRGRFAWPGLLRAPVLVVFVADPSAYVGRYGEPDKAHSGLGRSADRWSVPFWFTDAAFAAMLVLLGAVDEGLGALFFGVFEHEEALVRRLSIPDGRRLLGTVALGYADGADQPGRSASRPRRDFEDVVHRGSW